MSTTATRPKSKYAHLCSLCVVWLGGVVAGGIPWVEVFVGGGILAVGAAVSAGLAVSALLHRSAPHGAVDVGERLGLPKLPRAQVRLHARLKEPRLQSALRTLVAALKSA